MFTQQKKNKLFINFYNALFMSQTQFTNCIHFSQPLNQLLSTKMSLYYRDDKFKIIALYSEQLSIQTD